MRHLTFWLQKFHVLYKSSLKSRRGDEVLNTYFIRPLAAIFVGVLFPLPILPVHVVLTNLMFGLVSAVAIVKGQLALGGILLFTKNILDAVDGQLARARHQEDRRGRFLDSISDFLVNFAVFLALGLFLFRETGNPFYFLLAFLGFLGLSLRVSYFVYYFVSFLHSETKLTTNRTIETITDVDRQGDPVALRLQRLYLLLYGWQDHLIRRIDRWSADPAKSLPPHARQAFTKKWFTQSVALRLSSFLGLGTELTFVIGALFLKHPGVYLYFNLIGLNSFALLCIWYRRRLAVRLKIFFHRISSTIITPLLLSGRSPNKAQRLVSPPVFETTKFGFASSPGCVFLSSLEIGLHLHPNFGILNYTCQNGRKKNGSRKIISVRGC